MKKIETYISFAKTYASILSAQRTLSKASDENKGKFFAEESVSTGEPLPSFRVWRNRKLATRFKA